MFGNQFQVYRSWVCVDEKVSSIELIDTDAASKVVAKAPTKFWRAGW
ncbi:hypothetical protein [Belnapia rosea]|uniref:Uncharacterized protein n=1 Tax=Belnapia rosea TaxID=938405 RepID=A0A1G6Z251_9PROT|nr:hypothetical protein [Belnapia rosea]SDD96373.1 hypothetical protein SAMN04487779_101586 [Belnapia rosea]